MSLPVLPETKTLDLEFLKYNNLLALVFGVFSQVQRLQLEDMLNIPGRTGSVFKKV